MINIIDTNIKEVKIIDPKVHSDNRGYFFESYHQKQFYEKIGHINFIQENQSKSSFGVLRGLHFQKAPFEQSKLVRVVKGEIQDISVDVRKDSLTYLKYVSINLSDKNMKQLYIPKGFAHAFLVLSKEAVVCYKVDNYFNINTNRGLMFDDPKIEIQWELPKKEIILSEKDKSFNYL